MPFSDAAYEELKAAGYLREKIRGHDVYGIRKLEDLDHLLGGRWYLRILSQRCPASIGDFCYCAVGTVHFFFEETKANCRTFTTKYRSIDGGYQVIISL